MPHYKSTYLTRVILRFDYDQRAVLEKSSAIPTAQFAVLMTPGSPGVNFGQRSWIRVQKTAGIDRSVTLAPTFLAIEYGPGAYKPIL